MDQLQAIEEYNRRFLAEISRLSRQQVEAEVQAPDPITEGIQGASKATVIALSIAAANLALNAYKTFR
jgi:hypothetical protein